MIIFKKLPDGTWEKSGEILPTESHYRIAVDAENPGSVHTAAEAVAKIEKLIASKETGEHYRFELAMPPASINADLESQIAHLQETEGLSRKSAMQKIRRASKPTVKTPQRTVKVKAITTKPKAARKAKPVTSMFDGALKADKAAKPKSANWEEKRAAEIASPRFLKAYEKALAARRGDSKTCKHGHKVSPANTHTGDLYRTGLITCFVCNQIAQERYRKGK